jgi:hypothetical protein
LIIIFIYSLKNYNMKQFYLFLTTCLFINLGLSGQSPYVSSVLEYKPAPGQFINTLEWGSPSASQSIIGGISGHVCLGAFGGYIIVGFDHSIENDPGNPYGVDFTIFGNAFTGWSEPGIVYVMKDENNNGMADDTWYQLKGSEYTNPSTVANYNILYANPNGYADVPWRDNLNRRGAVLVNAYHTQPYYPSNDSFPNVNPTYQSYSGTMIEGDIDDSNPSYIRSFALDYGYADNNIKKSGDPVTQPDNPSTTGTLEGAGGDAMKIEWAIDALGNPVTLDEIDFIKIHTGINRMCGWLGEVSTEICGIVDVAPSGSQQLTQMLKTNRVNDVKNNITVLPTPSERNSEAYNLYDIHGNIVLSTLGLNDTQIEQLQKGVYLADPQNKDDLKTFKIIIE